MSKERDLMIQKLKIIVIPYLKELGFTGQFPHFRRMSKEKIDLLTFQFSQFGGGFVVEIAKCSVEGITTYWDKKISPNKITAHDLSPDQRPRLGSKNLPFKGDCDYWFRYDKLNLFGNIYEKLAKKVIKLIDSQAEPYWKENKWKSP